MALEIAATLVRHGADLNVTDKYRESLLLALARRSTPEVVELLLKRGANPNHMTKYGDSESPLLTELLSTDHPAPRAARTLELLLAYGANPNAKNSTLSATPLYRVIRNPEPQLVQVLLRYGASIGEAYGGHISTLCEALQAYLDAAATHRVAAQKAKDVTAILLRHGAKLRPAEEPIVAKENFQRYLDLAPHAPEAHHVRQLLQKL